MGKVVNFRNERKKEHPDTTFLKKRFPRYINPIISFLNKRNPFSFKSDFRKWATYERFITREFSREVINMIPSLKSEDPAEMKRLGILGLLENDMSVPNVTNLISGFCGHEKSPRWGLLGMIMLMEDTRNLAGRDEFERAVFGLFKYLDSMIGPVRKTFSESGLDISNQNIPLVMHEDGNYPLGYLVHIIDGYVINFAYHTSFDHDTFAKMSLEWSRIPGSIGSRYPDGFFDGAPDDSAFSRTLSSRILEMNNSGMLDERSGEWLRTFTNTPVPKNPNNESNQ
jgi:hypothetical protein